MDSILDAGERVLLQDKPITSPLDRFEKEYIQCRNDYCLDTGKRVLDRSCGGVEADH
jgi:hypothetical protein